MDDDSNGPLGREALLETLNKACDHVAELICERNLLKAECEAWREAAIEAGEDRRRTENEVVQSPVVSELRWQGIRLNLDSCMAATDAAGILKGGVS